MTDDIDWEWQRIRLENDLMKIDGDAFETRFQEIAKAAWGPDFSPSIPMGSRGDLKCDGYKQSDRTVFQCFGPRYGQVDVADALEKVNTDYAGAVGHWGTNMAKWVFAVNVYRDKVPSEIIRAVAQLSDTHSIPTEIWTRQDIQDLAKTIPAPKRRELLGHAPVRAEMVRITYEYIGRALVAVRGDQQQDPLTPVQLPPAISEKIDWNQLSTSARSLLTIGQTGAERVRQYLLSQVDPSDAEKMAQGFVARYKSCRGDALEPDQIFQQMVIFAGGATGDPDRDCAALAIVSHFFSTCEIFERPAEKAAP